MGRSDGVLIHQEVMFVPYIIFLLLYFVSAVILLVFSMFNLYHMLRYAFATAVSVAMTLVFVFGIVVILSVSVFFIVQIDWSQGFIFSLL